MHPTLLMPSPAPGGLAAVAANAVDPLDVLKNAWLAGYRNRHTREAYRIGIEHWFGWCAANDLHPVGVIRAHIELYQRHLEDDDRGGQGARKPRTIAARLNALASFYGYLVDELVLERDPMRGVRRPKIERRSPSTWLGRGQLADLVTVATELERPAEQAAILVLVFNGLRVGELCGLDVESLVWEQHSPVLHFTRKGGKHGRAALSRPTEKAVAAAIGDRTTGPMLLNRYGNRMTRANVSRVLDRCMADVRVHRPGKIHPHSLRHSWATGCAEARVPVEQIQQDGGWNDLRLVSYYTHANENAERAATHAFTSYVYGAV